MPAKSTARHVAGRNRDAQEFYSGVGCVATDATHSGARARQPDTAGCVSAQPLWRTFVAGQLQPGAGWPQAPAVRIKIAGLDAVLRRVRPEKRVLVRGPGGSMAG